MTMKIKILKIAAGLFFFIAPRLVFAASYFEFAPDISNSVQLAAASATQTFRPINDFLKGVDVWLENEGANASLDFFFYDKNGVLLLEKTAAVPYLNKKWGGRRFSVGFDRQIAVNPLDFYSFKLTSSSENLLIYYANRVQLLQHASPYFSQDIVGSAEIGDLKDITLKYALNEEAENNPPAISGATTTIISSAAVKISFNGSEPIDYKIEYAPSGETAKSSTAYSGYYQFCGTGLSFCAVTLSVSPNSRYDYEIFAKDAWGNESRLSGVFDSLAVAGGESSSEPLPESPPADSVPPAISDLRVAGVTESSVKIAWQTDEAADAELAISKKADGSSPLTLLNDFTVELEHVIQTGGILTPATRYYAVAKSKDAAGNFATATLAFTTAETAGEGAPIAAQTPPLPSSAEPAATGQAASGTEAASSSPLTVSFTIAAADGGSSPVLEVTWQAPPDGEPNGGYRVDIFDENNNLTQQKFLPAGVYRATFDDLPAGNYYAIVYANRDGVFEKISAAATVVIIEAVIKKSHPLRFYLTIALGVLTVAAFIVFIIKLTRMGKFSAFFGKKEDEAGFSVIEILVNIAIVVSIVATIGFLSQFLASGGLFLSRGLEAHRDFQQALNEMSSELRSMGQSGLGSYPIAAAGTSSVAFYSDIYQNGVFERIRYFMENGALKKGVITPTGNPLVYGESSEQILQIVSGIATTTSGIFSYYGENGSSLSFPVDVSAIRMISVNATVNSEEKNKAAPAPFQMKITPRNLRSGI
ncbi:MAG: fibronectin type III domain-containing protein [Parcubacteria group bacterium]|nr:fibronectin type III domain-containing protein [Parcubacteria group bacterium]